MPPTPRNLQLHDAIGMAGCPVCRMVVQRVAQTIESIQDELVLDPAYREQVDAAWGFCNLHAQQWLDDAQPLSTAIIYEAVLGRIDRELERVAPSRSGLRARLPGDRAGKDRPVLAESRVCPLCLTRAEQERQIVAHLLEEMRTTVFRGRYAVSDGLCVPHLDLALRTGPHAEALDTLRNRAQQTHDALRRNLREVIRKHDYRYREEPAGEEWGAVEQAVRQVIGQPGIDRRRGRAPSGE